MSLRTRTTTAFITSPFFTRPRGIASFTDTTMTSPMVAYFRLDPPSTLMHMTLRAPELSATSSLVCIWIMVVHSQSLLPRGSRSTDLLLLFALDDFPPLQLRQRAPLLDPDEVAHGEFVLLVVGVVLLRAPHRLLEHGVRIAALDLHDDGLVLLVADDDAMERALGHLDSSYFARERAARLGFMAAVGDADAGGAGRFCPAIVLMRAMSRRTWRTRDVFSS